MDCCEGRLADVVYYQLSLYRAYVQSIIDQGWSYILGVGIHLLLSIYRSLNNDREKSLG